MIPIRAQQAAGRMHWLASWVTPVVALVAYLASGPQVSIRFLGRHHTMRVTSAPTPPINVWLG